MRGTPIVLIIIGALMLLAATALAQSESAANTQKSPVRAETVRPAPCILPTLKIVSAQMMPLLAARLDMNEDQKGKVLELLTKLDSDIKPKIEYQNKAAREYIAMLTNSAASQAELAAAGDKVLRAESEVLRARIGGLFALRALLNPDQNKLLTEYLENSTKPWRDQSGPPGPPAPTAPPAN